MAYPLLLPVITPHLFALIGLEFAIRFPQSGAHQERSHSTGTQKSAGLASRAAGEEERSQCLVSPSSWVSWSPSEHTFSDCSIPPAPGATPAFPVSPLHLSSASTCLLSPCVGCLWNTYSWWPPGFLPAFLL